MILTCNQCSRRYLISDTLFVNSARQVRCGGCGHTWVQEYQSQTADAKPEITEEAFKPVTNAPLAVVKSAGSSYVSWGWLGYWLSVLGIFAALIIGRHEIVEHWPMSAKIYNALGLNVVLPGQDLQIKNLEAYVNDNGQVVLKGQIVNVGKEQRSIPKMLVSFKGKDQAKSQHSAVYQIKQNTILPGEVINFETPAYQVEGEVESRIEFI